MMKLFAKVIHIYLAQNSASALKIACWIMHNQSIGVLRLLDIG